MAYVAAVVGEGGYEDSLSDSDDVEDGARNVAALTSALSGRWVPRWSVASRTIRGLLRHSPRLRDDPPRRSDQYSCDCYKTWDGLNVSRGLASVYSSEPQSVGDSSCFRLAGQRGRGSAGGE